MDTINLSSIQTLQRIQRTWWRSPVKIMTFCFEILDILTIFLYVDILMTCLWTFLPVSYSCPWSFASVTSDARSLAAGEFKRYCHHHCHHHHQHHPFCHHQCHRLWLQMQYCSMGFIIISLSSKSFLSSSSPMTFYVHLDHHHENQTCGW